MKATFEDIKKDTTGIMCMEMIDSYDVVYERWSQEEEKWAKSYEGAHVILIQSKANNFFNPPRPPAQIGKTGILLRFDFPSFKGVFELNQIAKARGFSGLRIRIKFDDGGETLALLDEVQLVKKKTRK
jgi:hypothetical protein